MSMKIILSGYTSMDRIIKVSAAPTVGQTSIILNKDNTDVFFGGCAPNIAYNLSRLGVDAFPVMRVGRDFASTGYQQFLRQGKVRLDYVTEVADAVTAFCYLLEDPQKEHTTVFYPGAQAAEYFEAPPDDLFKGADYGVLTVGAYEDNKAFVEGCKKHGVPLVFGMRWDRLAFPGAFLTEVLTTAQLVFMNELECALTCKHMGIGEIEGLFPLGQAQTIVVTQGARGSTVYTRGGGTSRVPVCPCRVVDTTGSGDAYISGFLFGLSEQQTPATCGALGAVLSSFVIEAAGCCTNAPDKQALYERYAAFSAEKGA